MIWSEYSEWYDVMSILHVHVNAGVWTQTNGSESKRIEANVSSFRFAWCSNRIFQSELKRIFRCLDSLLFRRVYFEANKAKANIFICIFTNQSEYSPNKTSIRFIANNWRKRIWAPYSQLIPWYSGRLMLCSLQKFCCRHLSVANRHLVMD
jgi:hypothetical protein